MVHALAYSLLLLQTRTIKQVLYFELSEQCPPCFGFVWNIIVAKTLY